MLFIKDNKGERGWHIGTPFPKMEGRVIVIQADGDELAYLERAIQFYEKNGKVLTPDNKAG